MRPVSGNGRRSFFAETFLLPNPYNANKLPDLYLVILSQPVLEIHMISCYPAAPQGRKKKGVVCAVLECGGSWEGSCCLSAVFGLLPLSAFLPLLVLCGILYCLARYLPCASCPLSVPACFLVFDLSVPIFFLPLGLPVSAACFFFLSDFVTSGLGRVMGGGEECERNERNMREKYERNMCAG